MKKTLLTLTAIASVSILSAQITITQTDIAPLYSVVLQVQDTTPTVNEGSAGASQTYSLIGLNNQGHDSLLFTLPQFTPSGSSFPGSNLAVVINTSQAYMYFNSTPSTFEVTGQAADPIGSGMIEIPFSDFETQMNFPCNYNDSWSDVAKGTGYTYLGYDPGIGFQVDSVRINSTVIKSTIVDGWGSIITPMGTYNGLRINTIRRQVDTIDIQAFSAWIPAAYTLEDSSRTYSFWSNGIGFALAELTDYQDLGTITSATWIATTPQQIGMSEFANTLDMNVYPNPSVETVTFQTKGTEVKSIRILDMNGKVVRNVSVNSSNTLVDVSELATGMYFYQACDINGTILDKGKINIAH